MTKKATKTTRRSFLTLSMMAAGGAIACSAWSQPEQSANVPPSSNLPLTLPVNPTMPERLLGNTGQSLPIFGLGGASRQTPLSKLDRESAAVQIIERALELGIRYFDTAPSYGPSEDYLGKVLPPDRSQIFLASKTSARDRDGAWRELERSLQRLNSDYLDLWQLHHVSFDGELDQIFQSNGAIKAIEEAKAQKIIRFSGITGHHEPDIIVKGLERYPFDTTLIPVNAAERHHPRSFISQVLPVAQRKNIGVIAMKVPAYGKLLTSGVLDGMAQAMGYSLSQPGVHCCIVAADTVEQLAANVAVAQGFKPLSQTAIAQIEQRTAAQWEDNTFFRAWT
jgi:aryl-alcohol dehydrogenase-like predicted oxidoreductase